MSNPTELPDLDLDGLEALCKNAPAMWYGTLQIADGVTDDNAALLIEACSPDTVAELVRLARRAQPEGEAPLGQVQYSAPITVTSMTLRKREFLEQKGYSVVGYVMQDAKQDRCTVAHGKVEWDAAQLDGGQGGGDE